MERKPDLGDRIIDLSIATCECGLESGRLHRVVDRHASVGDPGTPIPPEIVRLTGVTDAIVRGQRIDEHGVARALDHLGEVICHNARFDRAFREARYPAFAGMRFACSLEEVPWEHWRMNTTKLDYIGFRFGLFHEGHRARADVDMLLAPLARTTPEGEEGILSLLLAPARDPRLWELPAAGPRVDPPPSRNRRTSSINAWPGNPDRRPPAARDAGQAHVSSRRHTPRTPDALEAPAPTAFRARSNP